MEVPLRLIYGFRVSGFGAKSLIAAHQKRARAISRALLIKDEQILRARQSTKHKAQDSPKPPCLYGNDLDTSAGLEYRTNIELDRCQ